MRVDLLRGIIGLAIVAASLVLTVLVVMGHFDHDAGSATMVGMVLGGLLAESKTIIAWCFSSTASSSAKDATIQLQAQAAADVAAPAATVTTTTTLENAP